METGKEGTEEWRVAGTGVRRGQYPGTFPSFRRLTGWKDKTFYEERREFP